VNTTERCGSTPFPDAAVRAVAAAIDREEYPMDGAGHLMMCTETNGAESLFECTVGCGRRLVLDHVGGRLTVIDLGDASAPHHGSTGMVGLSAGVHTGDQSTEAA
jgi:hypothetical protein